MSLGKFHQMIMIHINACEHHPPGSIVGRQEPLQLFTSDFINVLFRTVARKTQGIVPIRSLHGGERGGEGRGGKGRGGEEMEGEEREGKGRGGDGRGGEGREGERTGGKRSGGERRGKENRKR